jgi:hypothetical protein
MAALPCVEPRKTARRRQVPERGAGRVLVPHVVVEHRQRERQHHRQQAGEVVAVGVGAGRGIRVSAGDGHQHLAALDGAELDQTQDGLHQGDAEQDLHEEQQAAAVQRAGADEDGDG